MDLSYKIRNEETQILSGTNDYSFTENNRLRESQPISSTIVLKSFSFLQLFSDFFGKEMLEVCSVVAGFCLKKNEL